MQLQIADTFDQTIFLIDPDRGRMIDIRIRVKLSSGGKKGDQQYKTNVKEPFPREQYRLTGLPKLPDRTAITITTHKSHHHKNHMCPHANLCKNTEKLCIDGNPYDACHNIYGHGKTFFPKQAQHPNPGQCTDQNHINPA